MTLPLELDLRNHEKVLLIGDVHGEASLLEKVLQDPEFKDHYYLVIGDLFDRGPDSPKCWQLIQELRRLGKGSSLMGNHELNTAIGDEKEGNGWFFNNFDSNQHERMFLPCAILDSDKKEAVLDFINKTPLYARLKGDASYAIHAFLDTKTLHKLKTDLEAYQFKTWKELYDYYDLKIKEQCLKVPYHEWIQSPDWIKFKSSEKNPDRKAFFTEEIAEFQYKIHMDNPLKLLLAGPLDTPVKNLEDVFYAGGRWRTASRSKWWQYSNSKKEIVFGHYWRRHLEKNASVSLDENFGPVKFDQWLGPHKTFFCLDYCAGYSFKFRSDFQFSSSSEFRPALGVMSWPSKKLKIYAHD